MGVREKGRAPRLRERGLDSYREVQQTEEEISLSLRREPEKMEPVPEGGRGRA